jgi:hypothetical protein
MATKKEKENKEEANEKYKRLTIAFPNGKTTPFLPVRVVTGPHLCEVEILMFAIRYDPEVSSCVQRAGHPLLDGVFGQGSNEPDAVNDLTRKIKEILGMHPELQDAQL